MESMLKMERSVTLIRNVKLLKMLTFIFMVHFQLLRKKEAKQMARGVHVALLSDYVSIII